MISFLSEGEASSRWQTERNVFKGACLARTP